MYAALRLSWLFTFGVIALCGGACTSLVGQSDDENLLDGINGYLVAISDAWNDREFRAATRDYNDYLDQNEDKQGQRLVPFPRVTDLKRSDIIARLEELLRYDPDQVGILDFSPPRLTRLGEGLTAVIATWRITRDQRTYTGEYLIGVVEEEGWAVATDSVSLGEAIAWKKPKLNFGWVSVIPPLLAIFLAIITRRVLISLFFGILVGCGMLAGTNGVMNLAELGEWFIRSVNILCETILWAIIISEDKQRILWFVVFMGAMVGVIHRTGGMLGIVDLLTPLTRTRVGGQVVTWFLGLIVFFDDYANTLLLGNTMRPVTDRLRISREKLAYIVDSTAAPIAGLAIISTWVAMLITQVDDGFRSVNASLDSPLKIEPFTIVLQSIPYRFYLVFTICFVLFIAVMKRDFGPMFSAEQRAADGQPATPDTIEIGVDHEPPARRWYDAVVPIIVLVGSTFFFLMTTGHQAAINDEVELSFFEIFSRGDSYIALVYGSLLGLLASILLANSHKSMSGHQTFDAAWAGVKTVVPAMAILWLAWSLSELTTSERLGTQDYLAALLTVTDRPDWCPQWLFIIYGNLVSVLWLPTAIFLLSSFVAFATGTSWGTMGIMAPLVVKVTYELTTLQIGECPPDHPVMLTAIGSVIAGSIFGDHCSPISDTTVLSSQASGCNHIAHVQTQIPYAFLVGGISILFGTLPVGVMAYYQDRFSMGLVLPLIYLLGVLAMLSLLFIFGKRLASVPS
ncbi:MAG TPA: Na+/H+ antiporter NhaC family protein [Pirellulaceae bacterium]|nr:Na+/H+ antiporter NhaC family protein [Pirellulaceae bacterium]HMO91475.1 Na+/H+ antiporter NhaC family protein [Pirellulaceae bacterium]HMP70988.1 Na+/H+ antiporter NhaC family protein [Pirellulaceae bacterium]